MSTVAERRFPTADLELLQHDNKRYEIIDGELYVSTQPSWTHQTFSSRINTALQVWSYQTGAGQPAPAPGLIFSDDNDVAPDLIWISNERLAGALDGLGRLEEAVTMFQALLTDQQRILDIQPEKLHQRVAVVLGSKNEVDRVTQYHHEAEKTA